ncbi:MAG: hypothetical protein ACFFC3_16350 [Candidatus Odinarchaeota archaeon]
MARLEFLEFKTNHRGISICDNYIGVGKSENILSMFSGIDPEIKGSCLTCRFFKYDECYFNRNEIQDIKNRLISSPLNPFSKHNKYKCELCGHEITQILTVLKRKYYKKKEAIEIPLICENCYEHLVKYGNIKKKINHNILFFSSILAFPISLTILTIVLPFFYPLSPNEQLVYYFIVLLFLILGNIYLIYVPYKRIRTYVRGNRFSKSFLSDAQLRNLIFK